MIANDCPRCVMAPNRWLKVGSSLSRRFPNDTSSWSDWSQQPSVEGEQISSCFPLARGRHNLPVLPRLFPKIHARVAPPVAAGDSPCVTSLRARRIHNRNPSRRANVLFSIAEGGTVPLMAWLLVSRPRETPHPHPIAIYTALSMLPCVSDLLFLLSILPSNIKDLDVGRDIMCT